MENAKAVTTQQTWWLYSTRSSRKRIFQLRVVCSRKFSPIRGKHALLQYCASCISSEQSKLSHISAGFQRPLGTNTYRRCLKVSKKCATFPKRVILQKCIHKQHKCLRRWMTSTNANLSTNQGTISKTQNLIHQIDFQFLCTLVKWNRNLGHIDKASKGLHSISWTCSLKICHLC
jgi:hypothetical protein